MASRKYITSLRRLIGSCLVAGIVVFGIVFYQVWRQSGIDEAQPADVIVVLGAAQYWGRPSPVLKARLDHALDLYRRELAPRIIATGGQGPGAKFSEGEVSRRYLSENGVPAEYVSVESSGQSTMQSTAAVAEMMDQMQLTSCIVVSDDYHIHRAKKMLEEHGLTVYGSPRGAPAEGNAWARYKRLAREAASYILWRVGIRV
ncbi:MAG: YdcF family protein [Acidobacteria bacterium]|nr:YdcF family protein [Acidobacteriota bacterium]MDA1233406.1 YdcF family protein [Acidobacteriota bacterium]